MEELLNLDDIIVVRKYIHTGPFTIQITRRHPCSYQYGQKQVSMNGTPTYMLQTNKQEIHTGN